MTKEQIDAGWTCMCCGMSLPGLEYHPYAACLMYMQCHDSETVRANLNAVRDDGAARALEAKAGRP